MRTTHNVYRCDRCREVIPSRDLSFHIDGGMDDAWIWFGQYQFGVMLNQDEIWCSIECFIAWMMDKAREYQMKEAENAI